MIYEYKTRPYAHQKKANELAWGREAFAFLMEMGTGKTKVMIDEAGLLFCDGKIDCALFLAPKGVYMNWVNNELPTHLSDSTNAAVAPWISGGGNKKQSHQLMTLLEGRNGLRICVMNTEALSSGTKAINYATAFLRSGRGYMGVDESTFIKNHSSNRTKSVWKLGQLAEYRRIATGSPVTRSPIDLYAQFHFLGSGLLGPAAYHPFRARYAILQQKDFGGRRVLVEVGYQNLDQLTENLKHHSYRVTKDECLDLPPKVYTTRNVDLTIEQIRMYDEMKRNAQIMLTEGDSVSATAVIVQILRLHQIVCGHLNTDDGEKITVPSNRVTALRDVVSEVNGKVIIWARYRFDIEQIVRCLRHDYGENSVAEFHGGNTKTRQNDADRFLNDPECRFMVSNQQSGGYGNTWVVANTVIYYSNDYDLEKRLQSEDRAHRSGQTKSVTYVDLVAKGTVDEKILDALKRKINISTMVTGDELKKWVI